jgi:superfamily II DNA or RNA helicase
MFMLSAFDTERAEAERVLFVAHREELLRQALGSFRAVLRDQNFGDLLVGGCDPEQVNHLSHPATLS